MNHFNAENSFSHNEQLIFIKDYIGPLAVQSGKEGFTLSND
jgi:hypothetical protein